MERIYVDGNNGLGGDGLLGGVLGAAILGGGFGGWGGRGGYGAGVAAEGVQLNDTIQNEGIRGEVCDVLMAVGENRTQAALNSKDLLRALDQNSAETNAAIAACCCTTQRSIDQVRADANLSNCQQNNLIQSLFCNQTQVIKDGFEGIHRANDKQRISELEKANALLLGQISQENQTRRLEAAIAAANTTPAAA